MFLVGSFAVFSIAAEQSNVETAYWMRKLSENSLVWRVREPTSDDIKKVRQSELGKVRLCLCTDCITLICSEQTLQAGLARLKDMTEDWSQTMRSLAMWSYIQVFQPILDAGDGKRACWAIGAVNTAIWAVWQFPRFQPFMMRHFTHNPLSGISYTLLTSMFR